jgi:hypothetical protein
MQRSWHDLSDGKPIVVTRSVAADATDSGLVRVWNEYVHWRKEVEQTLPEEERLFTTTIGGKTLSRKNRRIQAEDSFPIPSAY